MTSSAAARAKRMASWASRFAGYRQHVTKASIEDWVAQFGADSDIAHRVLDEVDYFDQGRIATSFRQALNVLPDWNVATALAEDPAWRFVAMSGSAGESGNGMLWQFRIATGLDRKKYNELFIERSELVSEGLGARHRVVFVDDWSGTGQQVCNAWSSSPVSFAELTAGAGRVYLLLVANSFRARERIARETALSVLSGKEIGPEGDVFADRFVALDADQKKRLLKYCRLASASQPKGWGDCGMLVVFQHRTPNNSIPVLHASHPEWQGLFPRQD